MNERARKVVAYLDDWYRHPADGMPKGYGQLRESIRYSLLQDGGKRFRPVLAMLTAEALGKPADRVVAFAAAVECIHTYSLIHDDLPAMDDDDFRRGQPTNHKKFGESLAILAGDALLTEAFTILSAAYYDEPHLAVRVIMELAKASGSSGMVGGQAIDMASKKDSIRLDELRTMHAMKTGALIRVSVVGAAHLCSPSVEQLGNLVTYAENLGLAFQVADDLLDFDLAKPEPGSYPALLGPEKTKDFLAELTNGCLASLEKWPRAADPLREIAVYNQRRSV